MKSSIRFSIGSLDFLIPKNYEDYVGSYADIAEAVKKANKENPPSKGRWEAGSLNPKHINFLASLDDLGVMPKNFFDQPIVSGSYWFNWLKEISEAKYRIAFGKPDKEGRETFIYVNPSTPQSFFLTNWPSEVRKDF